MIDTCNDSNVQTEMLLFTLKCGAMIRIKDSSSVDTECVDGSHTARTNGTDAILLVNEVEGLVNRKNNTAWRAAVS